MRGTLKLTTAVVCSLILSACGGGWTGGGDGDASSGGFPLNPGGSNNDGTQGGGATPDGTGSGTSGNPTSYTVAPSVKGSGGTISPATAVSVASGATASFTVKPDSGYTASVGGTCDGTLNGNIYTTKPITANCTVEASFSAQAATYTVTPSISGSGGTIDPATAVSVKSGATTSFTVKPNAGYTATVSGSCNGTLNGNTYTTKAITANCTVVVSFSQPGSGTLAACFAPPTSTVNYALLMTTPDGSFRYSISYGPGTYNGYPATVTATSAGSVTRTNYSPLSADAGYESASVANYNGATVTCLHTLPSSEIDSYNALHAALMKLKPGEFIDDMHSDNVVCSDGLTTEETDPSRTTFIGIETITLAGKTFANTCRIRVDTLTSSGQLAPNSSAEVWMTSDYGAVQSISSGVSTTRYDGAF